VTFLQQSPKVLVRSDLGWFSVINKVQQSMLKVSLTCCGQLRALCRIHVHMICISKLAKLWGVKAIKHHKTHWTRFEVKLQSCAFGTWSGSLFLSLFLDEESDQKSYQIISNNHKKTIQDENGVIQTCTLTPVPRRSAFTSQCSNSAWVDAECHAVLFGILTTLPYNNQSAAFVTLVAFRIAIIVLR
jgi:hypothetical protein